MALRSISSVAGAPGRLTWARAYRAATRLVVRGGRLVVALHGVEPAFERLDEDVVAGHLPVLAHLAGPLGVEGGEADLGGRVAGDAAFLADGDFR